MAGFVPAVAYTDGFRFLGNYTNGGAGGTYTGNVLSLKVEILTAIGTVTLNQYAVENTINTTGGTTVHRGFYYNPTVTGTTGLANYAFESTSGLVKISTLAGTGTRMVVATADGTLDHQAIPSVLTINTNALNRILTANGTTTSIDAEANLTWDGTQFLIAGAGAYAQIGTYTTMSETVGGLATLFGNALIAGAGANTIEKTQTSAGNYVRMRYDQGISFGTNVTSAIGVEVADDLNDRMRLTDTGDYKLDVNGALRAGAGRFTGDVILTANAGWATTGQKLQVDGAMFLGYTGVNNAIDIFDNLRRIGSGGSGHIGMQIKEFSVGDDLISIGGNSIRFMVKGTNNAGGGIAKAADIRTTLNAAANNDVMVGLDINPTFVNGAFTGVENIALRIQNGTMVLQNALSQDDALTQVLVRDETTGQVKYRAASTLGSSLVLLNQGTNRVVTSTATANQMDAEANFLYNAAATGTTPTITVASSTGNLIDLSEEYGEIGTFRIANAKTSQANIRLISDSNFHYMELIGKYFFNSAVDSSNTVGIISPYGGTDNAGVDVAARIHDVTEFGIRSEAMMQTVSWRDNSETLIRFALKHNGGSQYYHYFTKNGSMMLNSSQAFNVTDPAAVLQVRAHAAGTNFIALLEDTDGTDRFAISKAGTMLIYTAPAVDEALEDVLVRDSTSGEVKSRTVASIIAEVPEQEVATYGNF
jgi:hypothetical protein